MNVEWLDLCKKYIIFNLATVIQKLHANQEKNRAKNETNIITDDSSDDLSYVWISPLVELDQENEEPKEKSPKLTKIKPKMLPSKMAQLQLSPRQDLNSLVTQELTKLEAERILEVEAKVSERWHSKTTLTSF